VVISYINNTSIDQSFLWIQATLFVLRKVLKNEQERNMRAAVFFWLLLLLLSAAIFNEVKSQAITGLQVVNLSGAVLIANLQNRTVIPLATYPNGTWTIVALATNATKSVGFHLDGNANFRTENTAPWSMTGNHPLHLPFQRGN
jgi:hypothetical protein